MGKKLKLEDWLKRCNRVHDNYYDYSLVSYKTVTDKVEIICPKHGSFFQEASSHSRGCGCSKCVKYDWFILSKEDFIDKANKKFNYKMDYSKVSMRSASDLVTIICPIHGDFIQAPSKHLRTKYGCPQCARLVISKCVTLTTEQFIEKARAIHGDKFDYSKSIYTNRITKLKIICPIHGEFETTPDVHLKPYACDCPLCSVSGWDRTSWIKICNKNKNSIPSVYIVRCYNENESFYKIGRTMRSINDRFLRPSVMPYKYELIHHIMLSPREIFDLEIELHRMNAEYRYIPQIQFPGSTECFSNFKIKDEHINR